MEAMDLAKRIFEIKSVLEKSEGVALYESQEWGFEPWLKVELCGILNRSGNVAQEVYEEVDDGKKKIDIVFNDDEWAISLKDRKKKTKSVLKNLDELKNPPYSYNKYKKTCLIFLTFPPFKKEANLDENIEIALKKTDRMYKKDFDFMPFNFKNNNPGRIWFVVG